MPDGVGREFADNTDDRMGRGVCDAFARHIEAHGQFRIADDRRNGKTDGRVHVALSEGVASQVEEAVLEFRPARAEGLRRGVEMPVCA